VVVIGLLRYVHRARKGQRVRCKNYKLESFLIRITQLPVSAIRWWHKYWICFVILIWGRITKIADNSTPTDARQK
jgi:hypothetical protein